jgi:hypothetical protein
MKYSLLVLGIIIGTHSFLQNAYAGQVKTFPVQPNQASNLVTKPASIDDWYVSTGEEKNTSIIVRRKECKKSSILNYVKNPDAYFQACPDAGKKITPSYEPVGETKIPHLNSGLSVTVTKF